MKFISKRVLAVVLAVVMLLGLLPVGGLFAGAATTEWITNGGFESGALDGSWYADRSSASVSSEQAHTGTYSAKISNTGIFAAPVSMTGGKTYVLSYWVYVPAGSTIQLQLYMAAAPSYTVMTGESGKYSVLLNNNVSAYDTWVQYTREFTLPETDTAMEFQMYSAVATDLYYIDDVSLTVKEAPKGTDHTSAGGMNLPEGKTNLIASGSFTGGLAGWGVDHGNGLVAAVNDVAKLTVDGSTGISQDLTVEANVTYTVSFYTWTTSVNNMAFGLQLNGCGYSWKTMSGGLSKVSDGWVEHTYTITPTESGKLFIKFRCVWGGAGEVYLDDVCVYNPNEATAAPVTPTDHGGDTELDANAVNVGPVNGDFSAASDNNNYMANASKADGMAKIAATGEAAKDYIQFNGMTVEAGKEYTLAFYVWIVDADDAFAFDVYIASGAGSPTGSWYDRAMQQTGTPSITADTNGWQRVAITWTPSASGDLNFGLKNYGSGSGTIYIDDVSVTTMPEEKTYIDIDFAVDTDVISAVAYNGSNNRTYLQVQTAQTLPVAGWGGYSGTTTLTIDGASVTAYAAGLGNANQMQVYTADGTGNFTGASKITVPAGAEFTSGDVIVRFVNDFIIVKKNGAWVKYAEEDEPVVTTPTDHTTSAYPEVPAENTNLAAGGNFTSGIPSGMSATAGLVTAADGMAIVTGNSTLVTVTDNSVAAGHTYTYTMYYWATELSGSPQFLVQAYYAHAGGDTGYKAKYATGLTEGTGWTKFVFEYTIPETAVDPYRLSFQIQSIERASAAGTTGTLYVDDISLYDQNEETKTYIDIAPNNGSVKLDSVGYNSGNTRSFIILETTETLPVANWATYSGSAYVNFDGTDVKVGFAGNNDANQFQIYVNDAAVKDDFSISASTIVIPANTEFASGNTVVRVTEAITLVNVYGIWMIDDPNAPEYQPIYADNVSMFAAVDQGDRNVFGFEVYGTEIPFMSSWANFGYNPILIDDEEVSVAFGTTDTDATWGMGAQNKFLIYTADGVYGDAQEMIIPAGTILVHPADATLAYLFTDDVVVTKTVGGGWPIETLMGAQVALGDTLKSDVTIRIPAGLYLDGMVLQYTVNGAIATTALTATGADQLYTATLSTAAKNVTDTYTLQLVDAYGNPVGLSVDYSIADYANAIVSSYIDGENIYTEVEMNAAASLLTYARYAQEYLGYKVDDLASDIWIGEEFLPEIDALIAATADMTASAADDSFVGCSLLLRDTTAIRLYFSEQHEGTLSASNGLYYVDITGISATNLATMYTAEVNGVTYNVSVVSLCKKVVASASTSDAFKMVARALYMYWEAATALANA